VKYGKANCAAKGMDITDVYSTLPLQYAAQECCPL